MLESDFANEIKNSFLRTLKPCHYNKIPDQIFNPVATFNPEKKYDAYVVYKGCFTAMEYKFHKKSSAFSFDNVTKIQITSLQEVVESGGNAYVVLGIRYNQVRETYFIPITDFLSIKNRLDRKSIPLVMLKEFIKINWLGKGKWEIKKEHFLYQNQEDEDIIIDPAWVEHLEKGERIKDKGG